MDPEPPPPPEAPPPPPAPERDAAAEAAATERKRVELTAELRRARGWILGVGIVLFAFDMFYVWGKPNDDWPAWLKYQISLLDGIILLMFVALWWFAQKKPRLCCILALALYWGLQVWLAWITKDWSQLAKGPLIKILFTFALIQGIKNAHNAEKMRADLAQVFG
jgi:hypothetical protein